MDYLTVKELVDRIPGANIDTVRRWCRDGKLPAIKIAGGSWLIKPNYKEWLADNLGKANE